MEANLDLHQRKDKAADKIQKLWRSYTNRKIYKYYRDIIMFKCKYNLIYSEEIQVNYSKELILLKPSSWKQLLIAMLDLDLVAIRSLQIFIIKFFLDLMFVISILLPLEIIHLSPVRLPKTKRLNFQHIKGTKNSMKIKDGIYDLIIMDGDQ